MRIPPDTANFLPHENIRIISGMYKIIEIKCPWCIKYYILGIISGVYQIFSIISGELSTLRTLDEDPSSYTSSNLPPSLKY